MVGLPLMKPPNLSGSMSLSSAPAHTDDTRRVDADEPRLMEPEDVQKQSRLPAAWTFMLLKLVQCS